MSWQERIKNKLLITTGDGKVHAVLWKNASMFVQYNGAKFSFPKVAGSLEKKDLLLGRTLPLEFYFVGDNNWEDAEAFRASDANTKPWIMDHPIYGVLNVQAYGLNYDNSSQNITKVTGDAFETILEEGVQTTEDVVDTLKLKEFTLSTTLEGEIKQPLSIQEVNGLLNTNTVNYREGVKIITLPEDAEKYFNAFNTASSAINTATASPILAMRAVVAATALPGKFTADVKSRISTLLKEFNNARLGLLSLFSVPSKQIYQIQQSATLASMCIASVTPIAGNYTNTTSVLDIINNIINSYRTFLNDMDTLQDPNGGNPAFFIPGYEPMSQLSEIINLTVSKLFEIALVGKKERSIILETDSNIVPLTHRFYGLDSDDQNIQELFNNNGFGLDHVLQIRKGTKIFYYV